MAWAWRGNIPKGNAVFIHSNGDVKKVAACKVKPYELRERNEERLFYKLKSWIEKFL